MRVPALPHLTSASVFPTGALFCGFKKKRKGRPGPVEDDDDPLQGVACETVAEADFT